MAHASLLVNNVHGSDSFHEKPAVSRRNAEVPEGPGAFLVSHAGFANGQDWCITAKRGVRNGAKVGFALCDFDKVS